MVLATNADNTALKLGIALVLGALLACAGTEDSKKPRNVSETPKMTAPPPDYSASEPRDRAYWERKCTTGQGDICTLVGGAYERGETGPWGYFPQDFTRAATFARLGCDYGHVDGCVSYAKLLLEGKGVSAEPVKALAIAREACDEKSKASACILLGTAFSKGLGVEKSDTDASAYYKRACALGEQYGCRTAALFEGSGQLSTADPPVGAGGFRLGAPIAEAQAACQRAGHGWFVSTEDAEQFYCDGTPGHLEFAASALINTCNGAICRIGLQHMLPVDDVSVWVKRFQRIEDRLWKLYGQPVYRSDKTPKQCLVSAATFASCLSARTAQMATAWAWANGTELHSGIANASAGPLIFVSYHDRVSAQKLRIEGL